MARPHKLLRPQILGSLAGILATGLLLAWLMGAFHKKTAPGERATSRPSVASLAITKVESARVPLTETAIGTIRAVHETTVASRVFGRIQKLAIARAGQPVKQGEVLVELEDQDLRAAVAQAKAGLKAAETRRDKLAVDLARTEDLRKTGVASEDKLASDRSAADAATAEAESARQAVASAESLLAFATIRAPIDGMVVDKKISLGDMALPGVPLFTLYDPSRLQLVAIVREELAGRLTIGQEVRVFLESLGHECRGTVSEIVPESQARTRSFEVKVVGPCAPGVLTGMFGRLQIPLGERDEIRVPRSSVLSVGQLDFVFVVGPDQTLARRSVRMGRGSEAGSSQQSLEILSGLVAGETIVADAKLVTLP